MAIAIKVGYPYYAPVSRKSRPTAAPRSMRASEKAASFQCGRR